MGEEDDGPKAVDVADIKSLETRVAAMRRLGVTSWGGIALGPVPQLLPSEPYVPKEPRPASAFEVHMKYWGRMRRSSGAPLPDCSKHCPCGGWKLNNDPGSVGG
jgi:hypothetical protein